MKFLSFLLTFGVRCCIIVSAAVEKGQKAIAARSLVILCKTESALERVGRGEIVNRQELSGVLL